ncbi:FecR family protein [Chitinophaga sancti]|uniref:FecR domain-containing protein n=1 Tax=Chitinophaga sancti TaxID=1004 RepID=A0ABZ0XMF1_9BACT|nr:FecR domain-containing protein [Chitinophaga sancti]WQG91753.1 FecR domain-containing protein [Chitinophaga sancti]
MSNQQLKFLLSRYLQGKATPAESAQVEAWYASFNETPLSENDQIRLKNEIISNVLQEINPPARVRKLYWYAAAAVLILLGLSLPFLMTEKKPLPVFADQQVSTPAGSRKTIRLSDGTVVQMNAGTTITIPGDFGVNDRAVSLSGEAFFTVASDAAHPFIIHTGNIQTRVLGTSFNIRSWPEEDTWEIGVSTGKVKVTNEVKHQIISECLTANKSLTHHRQSGISDVTAMDPGLAGAWRNNIFHFNNSSMAEIGQELQRQYNVPVTVSGAGKDGGHFKISFSKEPLDKVLKVLAGLTGITYTIKTDQVIIQVPKTN